MARALPHPRTPLAAVRRWYERELGWPTTDGEPVELLTGVRFDVLEMPADAGRAVLRRLPRTGPVALLGGHLRTPSGPGAAGCRAGGVPSGGDGISRVDRPKMLMLIAAGGSEELPGILEWLEWGSLAADLTARGSGGSMTAPSFPTSGPSSCAIGSREAAVWMRPPEPGYEAENSLPVTGIGAGFGERGCVPDLVRLVSAAATECHRARLLRARK
ncbi:SCO3374 family protein [Streptomyces benahoarensis]|uniref:Uncharacterized protein n=1 Tax=Streptomyces benahoarensis TaxID=2595054 RepID=A0A553Z5P4_9ACTN|nr:SCO3374 family protein [Streptomyces benahoarensis]TSB31430.1 hypothetical protein FNJ62_06335 [Streptomyces benahoarensis]TSB36764.1 hypothetical protein FNZ23_19350 [Streptomyces benahoarensis]